MPGVCLRQPVGRWSAVCQSWADERDRSRRSGRRLRFPAGAASWAWMDAAAAVPQSSSTLVFPLQGGPRRGHLRFVLSGFPHRGSCWTSVPGPVASPSGPSGQTRTAFGACLALLLIGGTPGSLPHPSAGYWRAEMLAALTPHHELVPDRHRCGLRFSQFKPNP